MHKDTALVLEGGGFRGIFTAGILEVMLENDLFFDSVYGVSAGASYGVSYLSKQAGRNIEVNKYIGDKRYCSFKNLIKKGSFFSWDFIFEEIPQNIELLNYNEIKNSPTKFYVGASDCINGTSEFFLLNQLDKADFKTVLSASCSLPLIAPIVQYQGKSLLDGGLADAIPYDRALADGNEKVIVVLTQPNGFLKKPLKAPGIFKHYYKKHPKVYEMLATRSERYNNSIQELEQLEKEGKAYVFRPNDKLMVSRLENKPHKTEEVYWQAYDLAQKELPKLKAWLEK